MKFTSTLLLLGMAVPSISFAQNAPDGIAHWDYKALNQISINAGYTFKAGKNWVTDYLSKGGSEFDITGLKHSEVIDYTSAYHNIQARSDLPSHFDWRDEVDGGMQPIRNQGSCGSCWAFSVVSVLESLIRIYDHTLEPNLAEQTLVSSCSNTGSCSGGYMNAFNYLKQKGAPNEKDDPYKAYNTSCRQGLKAGAKISEWNYVGSGSSSPTTEQIKTAIYMYGPVSVTVNGSFSAYSSGIYNRCNSYGTNHMVTLEGWDDEGQYWIMRNSWGTNWGEGGYMRIKWYGSGGYKCNSIGKSAAYAVLDPNYVLDLRQKREQKLQKEIAASRLK